MNALLICVSLVGKPNVVDVAAALIGATQNSHQPIRVAALGHSAKLVDKVSVWLPDSAIASAVVP